MHRVLYALGANGDADVVEAAEEGLPQLPVFDGERRVFLTKRRYSRVTAVSYRNFHDKIHLKKFKIWSSQFDSIPYPTEKLVKTSFFT
jgi:hypothetical protein